MNGDIKYTDDAADVPPREFSHADAAADKAEVAFFDTVLDAVTAAAAKGATVHALGFDSVDMFLRAGYRAVDGDADMIVVRGGESEFAKARALKRRLDSSAKLILCPTHAYAAASATVYRTTDAAFAVLEKCDAPFAVVFDADDIDRNHASIFGELAALDLCAFDYAFGARMRGECADAKAVADIAALVTELTEALRGTYKDRRRTAELLVEYGKKAARIIERRPELLHASGAAQTGEAVRMLYAAEERPIGMRGETEMLLAAYVLDFYMKNLDGTGLEFPPDNGKRIDSVCEYFKTDVRHACVHAAAVYPPIKMRICEYRRDEFRTELAKELCEVKRRQLNAFTVFKRLYPDDGYCLKTLVDRTDLGLCLALAPDVFAADSMLSFLKQTGRLEKYIV